MKAFKLKDIVFIALLSVVLLLTSAIIMPIVMFTQVFALRNLFGAFFFGLFSMIALQRVPRLGTLTLIGFFTGAVLGFMSIIMLVNNLLGAIIAELLVLIFFRNYSTIKARYFAAIIYMPLTIPITLGANVVIKGVSLQEQLTQPWLNILLVVGTVLLSALAARLGKKIADELHKAGALGC